MSVGRRYKVLIVEDDPRYSEPLKDFLNQTEDFKVVQVTVSAEKALQLVKAHLPDVLIVDLLLTDGDGDGMQLLQSIYDSKENLPIKPYILVTTNVGSEKTLARLNSGLADFIFSKKMNSYSPKFILGHLRTMALAFDCNTATVNQEIISPIDKETLIRTRVESELNNYYIKPNNKSKDYLIDAICMIFEIPKDKNPVYKEIFTKIGKRYNKQSNNVNMCIDNLIQRAFEKTDHDDLKRIYEPYLDLSRGAPTTSEFISYIANKIRRENVI